MKKKVCIVVLFLLLCLIKSSGVLAEEEKKILKTVVDDNGQVSSCTSSNTINTVKICDTENECNSVKNIYFCTQFELTYSNGKSGSIRHQQDRGSLRQGQKEHHILRHVRRHQR